jgi:hypothetical protein
MSKDRQEFGVWEAWAAIVLKLQDQGAQLKAQDSARESTTCATDDGSDTSTVSAAKTKKRRSA